MILLKVDPRAKVDSTQGFFLLYSTRILSLFSKNENISFLTDYLCVSIRFLVSLAFCFVHEAAPRCSLASPRIVQFSDANLLSFFRRILRNLYSFVKVSKMCVCPTCVTCDKRFLHYRHPTRKICYMVMDFGSHKADQTTPEIDFRSFASTKISCTFFAALIKVVHKFHG